MRDKNERTCTGRGEGKTPTYRVPLPCDHMTLSRYSLEGQDLFRVELEITSVMIKHTHTKASYRLNSTCWPLKKNTHTKAITFCTILLIPLCRQENHQQPASFTRGYVFKPRVTHARPRTITHTQLAKM